MASFFRQLPAVVLLAHVFFSPGLAQSSGSPSWPTQSFKSAPSVQPISLQVNKTGSTAPGNLFLSPMGSSYVNSSAPIIVSDDNDLIWFGPRGQVFNFGQYTYQGKPVLAYWNGTAFPEPTGRGYGSIVLLDSTYSTTATVTLPGYFLTLNVSQTFPSNVDLHELNITPQNTVLITANNVTQRDLSSVGGPTEGWTVDNIVYEIDIASNEIVFERHSLDHLDRLPFTASMLPIGSDGDNGTSQATAWNYFHVNAVSQYNGQEGYIISSRYFSSEICVQKSSGDVLWHDVRQQQLSWGDWGSSEVVISIFDNANNPSTPPTAKTPSSGLILKLDTNAKTAVALARYENPEQLFYSIAQGDLQPLPGGNKLVSYGMTPVAQEFDEQGNSVMIAQYGPIANGSGAPLGAVISYRTFRVDGWVGCPQSLPDVYAEKADNVTNVFMSWNGNTEYSSWTVLAGNLSSSASLLQVGTANRTGFETMFSVTQEAQYVAVRAVIGSTNYKYSSAQMLSKVVAVM